MASAGNKKNKCNDVNELREQSTEQLTSQNFALVKAMNNKDKELDRTQKEVQDMESNVKGSIITLQELVSQEKRLEQKKNISNEKLECGVNENEELNDKLMQVKSCCEEKMVNIEDKLEDLSSAVRLLEKERCYLKTSSEKGNELKNKNQKEIQKLNGKTEDLRSTIEATEAKICMIENKQQKINERSYKISKENTTLDQSLKSNVDRYNDKKNSLMSLEKELLEAQRSGGQSKGSWCRHQEDAQEKERQLQNAKASKFSTISDLFLLNDSIKSLRQGNKKIRCQIEQNRKDIVHWNDKNVKNTDALADSLNSRNRCSICGNEVSVQ